MDASTQSSCWKCWLTFCTMALLIGSTVALGNLTNIDRAQWNGVIIISFPPRPTGALPKQASGKFCPIIVATKMYPSLDITIRKEFIIYICMYVYGLPWWLSGKESVCSTGDLGSIPGLGRSPGGGHGNPLRYSCLENSLDRGAWPATVHRVRQSQTWLKWISSSSTTFKCYPFLHKGAAYVYWVPILWDIFVVLRI